jgi:hypothetical protein
MARDIIQAKYFLDNRWASARLKGSRFCVYKAFYLVP